MTTNERVFPPWMAVALATALSALMAGGVWYYRSQAHSVRQKAVETLESIGQLKAREITTWRSERLADAAILMERPVLADEIRTFLETPLPEHAQPLRVRFEAYRRHYGYADVLLADAGGEIRLSLSGKREEHGAYRKSLAEAFRERRPVLSELHAEPRYPAPHISAVAPILDARAATGGRAVGAVILVCDASRYLYPLVQNWPTPSETAETTLSRRENGHILFLNPLRHQPEAALSLRIPMSRADVPVIMAGKGHQGVVEGPDYRGVPVIAYILPIQGSSWVMVAKQDKAEIFAEWHTRSRLILLVLAAVAAGLVALALVAWELDQQRHYRRLYDSESHLRAATERNSITLKAIGDAVIVTDVQSRVELLNPVAESLTGWREDEARGKPLEEVFHIYNEETRREVENPVERVLREGKIVGLANHTVLLAKDGRERPIADSAAPIRDRQGVISGVVLVFRDQTLEQNYRILFQKMLDGFASHEILLDEAGRPADYRFRTVNPAFERMTGLRAEDIIGKTVLEVLPETERHWIEIYGRVALTGEPVHFERYARQIGKWFEVTAFRSAPKRFAAIFQDITERKRMEEALRESEKRYRSLTDDVLDNAEAGIFLLDADFRIAWVNRAMERFFGFEREQVLGADKRTVIRERFQPIFEDAGTFASKVFATYDNNTYTETFECHVLPGPGREERWLQHWSQPVFSGLYAGGRVEYYYDITVRKQNEAEQKRLALAIEHSGEMVVVTDEKGVIQYVNQAFEEVTGYSRAETVGQTPRLLKSGRHDAAFYREMWAVLSRGEVFRGRMTNRRKDGTLFTEDASIAPVFDETDRIVYYVSVKRDITERLAMEAELHQAQKMESVGQLAGGVAHDFNNSLGVILGNAELALLGLPPDAPQREELNEIVLAAKRSSEITQQLLAFARKQVIAPKVLDLNEAVGGMLNMLRRLVGENIRLVWTPGAIGCLVRIDPVQLNQILTNLCINARDAIRDVGRVTIETSQAELEEEACARREGHRPGCFAVLTVRDDGCGMDAETRSHLFEPFFTTKAVNKGTGLGLATIHGIVKQNHGFIEVESEPDQGSCFRIHLPCHEGEAPDTAAPQPEGLPQGRAQTILFVEDDSAILRLGRTMLARLGYRVLTAETPEAALQLANGRKETIDLLLTDVIMPGMNGRDLARALQERRPSLKTLFMSGYTANVIAHHGVLDEGIQFIQKPFTLRDLSLRVHETLTRDRPHAAPGAG
ncbi:MAG: PAS domain S-box protein [Kiritimatiellia bacterium]|jgi:PAS domain S-box-containing protein|nr:PAS domain S-box protein [Kiritimatiellia bacterium]